jgi:hypothetical protein
VADAGSLEAQPAVSRMTDMRSHGQFGGLVAQRHIVKITHYFCTTWVRRFMKDPSVSAGVLHFGSVRSVAEPTA